MFRRKFIKDIKGYGKRQYVAGFNEARKLADKETDEMIRDLKDGFKAVKKELKKSIRVKRIYFCNKCGKDNLFYPVGSRKSWSCKDCGYQVYPMAKTVLKKSTTPKWKWDKVTGMIKENKYVYAKDIQREIRVTYKTAWRMRKIILSELYPNFVSKGKGKYNQERSK